MPLNFDTEAKTLRPKPECLEAETEAKYHDAKVEAKIVASRPV